MLRITITDLPGEQRWSLEGQLVGEWAAELRSTWRKAGNAGATKTCIVDLIEVTAIDKSGESVLAEMMSQSAEFISGDVYTEHLLRKLRRELKRGRIKRNPDEGGTKS
jgi:hypothetical protein